VLKCTCPLKGQRYEARLIAFEDNELNEWLIEAIADSSGQFLPALAEAAVVACAEDYSLVRPVLIDLKRKYRFASSARETDYATTSGKVGRSDKLRRTAASRRCSTGRPGSG
jgi:hypothetical protein